MKLFAGGAVTDLCVRVLAPGSNMEGMDLGLLLDVDISVHSEICLPPVTLSLLLLAFGLLQLCRHPWSRGAVNDVTSDEGGVLVQNLAEATVVVFDTR